MPYKYKRRKRRYRRRRRPRMRRRRRRNSSTVMRVRGVTGFPDRLVCKLKFNDTINMVSTLGFGSYRYVANGAFDPDVDSGLNKQPLCFEEYSNLYTNYEVHASKIIVKPLSNQDLIVKYCVFPSLENFPVQIINDATIQSYATTRYVGNLNSTYQRPIVKYMSVKKLEGRQVKDDDFTASINSNPTKQHWWHISAQAENTASIASIFWDVQIIFYVTFFRRRILQSSTPP